MALENQDASVRAGDTITMEFTVTEGGLPKDLTGSTLLYEVKFPTPLQKTNSDMDLTQIASGIVGVTLAVADTRVAASNYSHALQVTLAGATEHAASGVLTVKPEIAQ